uniref:ShKT domain-containing protein n=1 Tax=Trichuris muris TaxID=70415 RepID=A0A5S6QP91_TRIMR
MRWDWTVVFFQCFLINRLAHCLPVNSLLQIDLEQCFPPEGRVWKRPDPIACGTVQCKFPLFCAVNANDDTDMECHKVTDACLKVIPINSLLGEVEEAASPKKEKALLSGRVKIEKDTDLEPVTAKPIGNPPSRRGSSVRNVASSNQLSATSSQKPSCEAGKCDDSSNLPMIRNGTEDDIQKSMQSIVVSEDGENCDEVMNTEVSSNHETANNTDEANDMDDTALDEGSGQMEPAGEASPGSAASINDVDVAATLSEEQVVALTSIKAESIASTTNLPTKDSDPVELQNQEKRVRLTTLPPRSTISKNESTASSKKVSKLDHCLDGAAFCSFWATMGECDRNPFWMKPNCQKSCRSCGVTVADVNKLESPGCRNNHELCQFWKSIKECEKNFAWMSVHCAASCNTCPPKI